MFSGLFQREVKVAQVKRPSIRTAFHSSIFTFSKRARSVFNLIFLYKCFTKYSDFVSTRNSYLCANYVLSNNSVFAFLLSVIVNFMTMKAKKLSHNFVCNFYRFCTVHFIDCVLLYFPESISKITNCVIDIQPLPPPQDGVKIGFKFPPFPDTGNALINEYVCVCVQL